MLEQRHGLGTTRPRVRFVLVLAAALAVLSGAIAGPAPAATATPAPLLGKTVNVEPIRGVIFVKLPAGAHFSLAASPLSTAVESLSKGVGFIPLSEGRQIPVGSTLDTTAGVVRLTTATATIGKLQFGDFGAGIFTVLQSRSQSGLTNLKIVDTLSPQQVCRAIGKKARAASGRLPRKVIGLLNGRAHGKFGIVGQYAAGVVRGTVWSVANRCDATLTHVTRGVVSVRAGRKTISLHAGECGVAAPAALLRARVDRVSPRVLERLRRPAHGHFTVDGCFAIATVRG
jgi:hypothetical protein